jgi:PAS domain S-box-containing protein
MTDSTGHPDGAASGESAAAAPDLRDGIGAYRALAESLEQCVFLLDAQGRYLAVNRSFRQWLGLSEREVLGRGPWELWPTGLADGYAADDRRALAGERVEREEQRPRGRQTRTVRTVKVPLRDGRGLVQGVLGTFRDVTEDLARDEQGRKLEALGRAAAGIAHDFSNLLAAILGHTGLLATTPLTATQRELVHGLERSVHQAAGLTDHLLAFVRRDGRPSEPVDLAATLRDLAAALRPTFGPAVKLEVRCSPDLPPVLADPAGVNQVLLNLCLNARDAMPQGGTLTLEAEEVVVGDDGPPPHPDARPGLFVRLRAEDTGCGMPPEVQARVFEPFFTTKGPGKGTGLGLAIVAGVVRQHGGWVSCASSVGQGTRFDVYFPRAGARPAALLPSRRRTVLVIDSDPQLLQLARTLLQGHGYEVLAAAPGPAAAAAFRQAAGRLDLVLLDPAAPAGPGDDGLAGLLAESPGVRVVLVSGRPARDLPPGLRPHLCGHLAKPFRKDQLLETVRATLARVPAHRPSDN